jgi:hypothetical protein
MLMEVGGLLGGLLQKGKVVVPYWLTVQPTVGFCHCTLSPSLAPGMSAQSAGCRRGISLFLSYGAVLFVSTFLTA